MSRITLNTALPAGKLFLLCLALAGCNKLTGEPTKQIETPVPPTFFVSAPGGMVARVGYEEPAADVEPFVVKPIAAWSEQETAADALGRIGSAAVPALIEALGSSDPEVRLKAAEVLARMGTDAKPAAAALTLLLDDPDERIRKSAARALGMIGPEAADAVPALMRSLTQPEPLPPSGELRPVPTE